MATEDTKISDNNQGAVAAASKKKKKSRKRKQLPKPGDPDYKTPTQLRNARKRRKKKQDKAGGNSKDVTKKDGPSDKQQLPYGSINDPSLKYLSNPKAAPTVRNAIRFFREKTHAQAGTNHDEYFPVTCGPKLGWRTVARLAVRSADSTNKKLRIGLFVPGSHELLPVPDCPVHHRKINGLVKILEETCNALGVPAVGDESANDTATINNNSYGLRYIAIAVERKTKRQQLVLVWKEPTQEQTATESSIIDELVQKLVKKSKDKTEKDIRLQSVWIHYNNTWKHSNSIFDREGRWDTKFVEGETKANKTDDPLFGAIHEAMLPLPAPKHAKDSKTNRDSAKTTKSLDQINVPLYFPPQVFRQANLDGFAKIILRIREWLHEQQLKEPTKAQSTFGFPSNETKTVEDNETVPPKRKRRRGKRDTSKHTKQESEGDNQSSLESTVGATTGPLQSLGHCLELYGGVGTIGLNLIDYFDSLDSSDENPFNEACFQASADKIQVLGNGLDTSKRSKITYTSKSASDIVVEQFDSLKKARVVVVDPPRKGLDPPVIEALCSDYGQQQQEELQHLVYVSCGFDAFRRDYRALVEHSGVWRLDRAEGHILFPGSDAIETLAFFTRNK